MASEVQITVRVAELSGGGFVIGEEIVEGSDVTFNPVQAVSSIDEACGAIQKRVREWNTECKRLRLAQLEDENPKIEAPRRWWRQAG